MSNIEPMSIEEIKRWLIEIDAPDESRADEHYRCFEVERRLILAWIYAEARAREAEWYNCDTPVTEHGWKSPKEYWSRENWTKDDWIAAVKKEVGWVD